MSAAASSRIRGSTSSTTSSPIATSSLCASRWNADMLKAKTRKRVEIIYEGIDHTLFRPGPRTGLLDQSKFYIFSGGKVEYRKGHDLVLLAFKEFSRRHDDAVLVTAWHSPWPQLSVGFKGKLNAPLELARRRHDPCEEMGRVERDQSRQGDRDQADPQPADAGRPVRHGLRALSVARGSLHQSSRPKRPWPAAFP